VAAKTLGSAEVPDSRHLASTHVHVSNLLATALSRYSAAAKSRAVRRLDPETFEVLEIL
jgi:hypothetical protein